jgi:hypothetical protein
VAIETTDGRVIEERRCPPNAFRFEAWRRGGLDREGAPKGGSMSHPRHIARVALVSWSMPVAAQASAIGFRFSGTADLSAFGASPVSALDGSGGSGAFVGRTPDRRPLHGRHVGSA